MAVPDEDLGKEVGWDGEISWGELGAYLLLVGAYHGKW